MKVVFVIKALANPGGGAERILCQVATGLMDRGHDVAIVSNDPEGAESYYPLDKCIDWIRLGIGDTVRSSSVREIAGRIAAMRRTLVSLQPDVAVGFMHSTYLPLGVSLFGTGIPLVASEHAGPDHYRTRPVQWLVLQTTPLLSDRITVVSDQIRSSFNRWLRSRMVTILNPVAMDNADAGLDSRRAPRTVLLSVGRLDALKDHRTLVSAFSLLAQVDESIVLRIVGEGGKRMELEAQVRELGLAGRVELPGAVSNVGAEYRAATLFVLPSRYESFGLATAEALLHGLPAVGFADCPGTNELIVDGVNGRLVEGTDRVAALAKVLRELMSDPEQRRMLSSASSKSIIDRFGIDRVLDQWEALLERAAGACAA